MVFERNWKTAERQPNDKTHLRVSQLHSQPSPTGTDRIRQQFALLHSHGSETSECFDGARAQSTLYLHSTIYIINKLFNFELRFSSCSSVRFCIVHRYSELASARLGLARSNSRRIHPLLIHRAGACAPLISIALEGEGESILNKTVRLSSSRRASPRNVF